MQFAKLRAVNGDDYGARVRAAQAFAGLDQTKFAEALGFSTRTLDRLYKNEKPLTIPEAKKIADVCKVPVSFLVEGWNVNRPIQDRLSEMERGLDELLQHRKEAQEQLRNFDVEDARELLNLLQEVRGRQGREVGRRELRSRAATGR